MTTQTRVAFTGPAGEGWYTLGMDRNTPKRVAFCGASGTGKSVLAHFVAGFADLTVNPVGSRSVAADMGFASPYEADKAGRRAEFQARLIAEKREWEIQHLSSGFVTDRTTVDNLAYMALHDVANVTDEMLASVSAGMRLYTHVIYCPVSSFCQVGNDPVRVKEMAYHRVYDALLNGLLSKYLPSNGCSFVKLATPDLALRKALLESAVLF